MIELAIGTGNQAKVDQIKGALIPLKYLTVLGIREIAGDKKLPEVEESGETAVENAHLKAIAYAQAIHRPVLSMDNALYFDALSTNEQPGLHVRRIGPGKTASSDEELLQHFSHLVARLGGETKGHWEFGICVANPGGQHQETAIISPRLFRAQISTRVIPGYPLESIQVDPESGKYISEMSEQEQAKFWQKAIGQILMRFVKSISWL